MVALAGLPAECPGWVFREDDCFGVAVELPEPLTLEEGFAGAAMRAVDRDVDGTLRHLLRLESRIEPLRNEFAVVCAQMLSPGDGSKRSLFLADPLLWWDRWRHLLGNAVVTRSSYDALAELLALERLLQLGHRPEWKGPLGGSVDIATLDHEWEVKSTISRYDSRVHVSGQFQLSLASGRPLNLLHYRFEPVLSAGDSIDSAVERLVEIGMVRADLENLLSRIGLPLGCAARRERYSLLEGRRYSVGQNFPRISPDSFVTGCLPAHIVQIEYQVDLSGLCSVVW